MPVLVTNAVAGGVVINAGASSGPGIASLYEAAVQQQYGYDYLHGDNSVTHAAEIVSNESTTWYTSNLAARAVESNGSMDGTMSVALTPKSYTGGSDHIAVSATSSPSSFIAPREVSIYHDHFYEVVDIKNGMIGLRNPWGINNTADWEAQDASGVFYISQTDFDRAFSSLTVAKQ
ncbi:MAG: hypothetical protein FWD63_08580 [Propionibacteriaceae bacterium]|nr:hypothetical protein [Propionibacteriaceae bacterium]